MATPVIRLVDLRELPSTRAEITWARLMAGSLFILIIMLEHAR
jgi:hypothetical protein